MAPRWKITPSAVDIGDKVKKPRTRREAVRTATAAELIAGLNARYHKPAVKLFTEAEMDAACADAHSNGRFEGREWGLKTAERRRSHELALATCNAIVVNDLPPDAVLIAAAVNPQGKMTLLYLTLADLRNLAAMYAEDRPGRGPTTTRPRDSADSDINVHAPGFQADSEKA